MAIKYDAIELEIGTIEIMPTSLNDAATLLLQRLLKLTFSLENLFEEVDLNNKYINKFNIQLSDFKIRTSIKNRNGSTVFTSPNIKIMYSLHTLTNAKNDKNLSIKGNLLFSDVTARGLNKSDFIKLNSLKIKDINRTKEFLFSYSKSSFIRVVPDSEPFQ
jgi:hypothetical protein